VDLAAEVAKCDKKIDLARLNFEKLYKVMSQQDYQTTVPEAVQLGNEEKVSFERRTNSTVLVLITFAA
jgi:valyl-tRNA synthetase